MDKVDKSDGFAVEEKMVFKVYDMPQSLSVRLISYSKEHSGNKVWVAIDQLLNQANTAQRLDAIEKRLSKLDGEKNDRKI